MNAYLALRDEQNTRWRFLECRAPRQPSQPGLQLADLRYRIPAFGNLGHHLTLDFIGVNRFPYR